MMKQVESDHYFKSTYETKKRFISYWHQINEIVRLEADSVLEIGIGNGFVSRYLKQRGVNITTLDIDKELNPDRVGSVLDIPVADISFDFAACYEVLEHLPFEQFPLALSEIFRVSKYGAILSLPDATRCYRLFIQIPKIGIIRRIITLQLLQKPMHVYSKEHCWEIGMAAYPLSRIAGEIKNVGFSIDATYRLFEHPYHRFFILKK